MLTMNKDKIAKELAELGHSDFRLLSKLEALIGRITDVRVALEANRKRRCELLSEVACHADAGLDGEVMAASIAPKDDGGK